MSIADKSRRKVSINSLFVSQSELSNLAEVENSIIYVLKLPCVPQAHFRLYFQQQNLFTNIVYADITFN